MDFGWKTKGLQWESWWEEEGVTREEAEEVGGDVCGMVGRKIQIFCLVLKKMKKRLKIFNSDIEKF